METYDDLYHGHLYYNVHQSLNFDKKCLRSQEMLALAALNVYLFTHMPGVIKKLQNWSKLKNFGITVFVTQFHA